MKKVTKRLAFQTATIHVLSAPALNRVAGGISGAWGCNYTGETECGVTYDACEWSDGGGCQTGSCNSLACTAVYNNC